MQKAAGQGAASVTGVVSYAVAGNNNAEVDDTGTAEQTVVSPANPEIVTKASPGITLDATAAPTISDSAAVSGAYYATGHIAFTMTGPRRLTKTVTDGPPRDGNSPSTASATLNATGYFFNNTTSTESYTLPRHNNLPVDDTGTAEQTVVSPASPTLMTAPPKQIVTLDATGAPTISDSADLEGAYNPTGSITFTLTLNNVASPHPTLVDTVTHNGTYNANYTLPTTGNVTGTCQ